MADPMFRIKARHFRMFHMDWLLEDCQDVLDSLDLLATTPAEVAELGVLIDMFEETFKEELGELGYAHFD